MLPTKFEDTLPKYKTDVTQETKNVTVILNQPLIHFFTIFRSEMEYAFSFFVAFAFYVFFCYIIIISQKKNKTKPQPYYILIKNLTLK